MLSYVQVLLSLFYGDFGLRKNPVDCMFHYNVFFFIIVISLHVYGPDGIMS